MHEEHALVIGNYRFVTEFHSVDQEMYSTN